MAKKKETKELDTKKQAGKKQSEGRKTTKAESPRETEKKEEIRAMQEKRQASKRMKDIIWGLVCIAVGAFIFASVQFHAAGVYGNQLGVILKGIFGAVGLFFPWYLILLGILFVTRMSNHVSKRTFAVSIALLLLLCLMNSGRFLADADLAYDLRQFYTGGTKLENGGLFGMTLGTFLVNIIGKAGLYIFGILMIAISLLLLLNTKLSQFLVKVGNRREEKRIMKELREQMAREEEAKRRAEAARIRAGEFDRSMGITRKGENAPEGKQAGRNKPPKSGKISSADTMPLEEFDYNDNIRIVIPETPAPAADPVDRMPHDGNINTFLKSKDGQSLYGVGGQKSNVLDFLTDNDPFAESVPAADGRGLDGAGSSAASGYGLDGEGPSTSSAGFGLDGEGPSSPSQGYGLDNPTSAEPVSLSAEPDLPADSRTSSTASAPEHQDLFGLSGDTTEDEVLDFRDFPDDRDGRLQKTREDAVRSGAGQENPEPEDGGNGRVAVSTYEGSRKKSVLEAGTAAVTAGAAAAGLKKVLTGRATYRKPPVNLLDPPDQVDNSGLSEELHEKAVTLEHTLQSFNVDARVIQVTQGPAVTRYEIQPNTGVKVSKIVSLSNDIALNLRAKSIRIEAPIPGKAAVGIEVQNDKTNMVRIREVIDSPEFRDEKSKIAFAVGKDISGNNIVADLKGMPHLLIAGSTGSGKSVCINSIIASILYRADPDEVKLVLIDPKVVELGHYNGIPHLLIPVVTDPAKAAAALNWAVAEMTNRYKSFADENVRDLKSFNKKMKKEKRDDEIMSQVVIIIDELADLMMAAPSQVEESIARLAQMARAAGMHLIVATQRPSVDVITGLIKANIPSRIAFAVSSQIDSRTILDMGGAEKLVGKGDMLFNPLGRGKPLRVQGTFISDEEVNRIIEFVKDQNLKTGYNDEVMDTIENGPAGGGLGEDEDELLPEAIECVVQAGKASTSMLQRRFRIGYNHAASIMDMMEERGVIGPQDGSRPRKVLLTEDELERMKEETGSLS